MNRYVNLELALREMGTKKDEIRFMEIGTYDGVRAVQLMKGWLSGNSRRRIFYYGFDLFEDLTQEMSKAELSKSKLPPAMKEVQLRMTEALPWTATVKLYKGNTRVTLVEAGLHLPKMDLIFQDGGHSLDTVRSDWENARRLMHADTIYLFDDYYENRDDFGCGPLVRELALKTEYNVVLCDPLDHYDHTNLDIRMARVEYARKRTAT